MCNFASFRLKWAKFVRHGVTTVVQSRASFRVSEAHRVVVQDVRLLQVFVDYNMQEGQATIRTQPSPQTTWGKAGSARTGRPLLHIREWGRW